MNTENRILVLARMEFTGVKFTGRYRKPDGVNYVPETETCWRPVALVWSSNLSDIGRGREFADKEGYKLLVLPNTSDVLDIARKQIQATHVSEPAIA